MENLTKYIWMFVALLANAMADSSSYLKEGGLEDE
jgi:hypothetical protein